MNCSMRKYKGYEGIVRIDFVRHSLIGQIAGIDDWVMFESNTVSGIETEFHQAVDGYIEFCRLVGKHPEYSKEELQYAHE